MYRRLEQFVPGSRIIFITASLSMMRRGQTAESPPSQGGDSRGSTGRRNQFRGSGLTAMTLGFHPGDCGFDSRLPFL